jgi:hypothetical protein
MGTACAGKSTLNRLETCEGFWDIEGTKKIAAEGMRIEQFFVKAFLNNHPRRPKRIVLDLDVTDNELHGQQEGRSFHGHDDCCCSLPLYIYCGDDLLYAKLRTADVDPAGGIIALVRRAWGVL